MHPCVLFGAPLPCLRADNAIGAFPSSSPPDAQCSSAPLEEPPLRPHCVWSPMLPSRRPAAAGSSDLSALPKTQHVIGPTAGPLSCSLGISFSAQSCMPSAVSSKSEWHLLCSASSGKAQCDRQLLLEHRQSRKVDLGHRLLPPPLHPRQQHLTSRKRNTIQKMILSCYYAKLEHVA
jgi:hypothetical protein